MGDFKNAVIYKIRCLKPLIPTCYIGSTKNFKDRIRLHKTGSSDCKILYDFVENNGGWNNFKFDVVEDAGYVNNRTELLWRAKWLHVKLN